jgi:uncharacterized protein with NRDE domain
VNSTNMYDYKLEVALRQFVSNRLGYGKPYGTRTHTIILVEHDGTATCGELYP